MKTTTQEKFDNIVKHCFHDKLKPLNFRKKANNFYRNSGELGQLVNVQKSMFRSKENISFTVNIGIFSPVYWDSEYNYNGAPEPPDYPNEPVCVIRLRLGTFIGKDDRWYDIDGSTNISGIKNEINQVMETGVVPFFKRISNNAALIHYLENEYNNYDGNYRRFILYGSLGMQTQLERIYPVLLQEANQYQMRNIQEKAKKFGL